jgi:xylulokinase
MPSFDKHSYYIGGPTSTSGRALEWWKSEILQADATDWTMLKAASGVEAGSEGLIFLPYLAGERAPLWDVNARGMFFGLALHHTRAHMTRAVMEGVAFSIGHIMEHIELAGGAVQEIHCCGGQAASELWCQIKADVTGKRVVIPQVIEAPVLGSATIAGVGVGAFTDFTHGAAEMVKARVMLEPIPENHARYEKLFEVYRDLYVRIKPLFGKLK